jgi:hypothetical protein
MKVFTHATFKLMLYINIIYPLLRDAICLSHNTELFEPTSSRNQGRGRRFDDGLVLKFFHGTA